MDQESNKNLSGEEKMENMNEPVGGMDDMNNDMSEEISVEGGEVGSKFKISRKTLYIIIIFAAAAVLLYLLKGYFVAATVNGSYISRHSVIKELEKQYGQDILEGLISKRLIEDKVKDIPLSKDDLDAAAKEIDDQFVAQGSTLSDFLKSRGMSDSEFRQQLSLQKKLEILLADKISVSDDEVTKYIKDNKVTVPSGADVNAVRSQVADAIKQQKFNDQVQQLLTTMKSDANIKYFVNY